MSRVEELVKKVRSLEQARARQMARLEEAQKQLSREVEALRGMLGAEPEVGVEDLLELAKERQRAGQARLDEMASELEAKVMKAEEQRCR